MNNTESLEALAQGAVSPSQRSLTIWHCIYCSYDVCTNCGVSALLENNSLLRFVVVWERRSLYLLNKRVNCKQELFFISLPGYLLHMYFIEPSNCYELAKLIFQRSSGFRKLWGGPFKFTYHESLPDQNHTSFFVSNLTRLCHTNFMWMAQYLSPGLC